MSTKSEFYNEPWSTRFKIYSISSGPTVVWKVESLQSGRAVSCYGGEAMAITIARTANCILEGRDLPTYHVNILKRARNLLNSLETSSEYKKKLAVRTSRDLLTAQSNASKRRRVPSVTSQPTTSATLARSTTRTYKCDKCLKSFVVEFNLDTDPDITECIHCDGLVVRTK